MVRTSTLVACYMPPNCPPIPPRGGCPPNASGGSPPNAPGEGIPFGHHGPGICISHLQKELCLCVARVLHDVLLLPGPVLWLLMSCIAATIVAIVAEAYPAELPLGRWLLLLLLLRPALLRLQLCRGSSRGCCLLSGPRLLLLLWWLLLLLLLCCGPSRGCRLPSGSWL